jgi:hypothetical protein
MVQILAAAPHHSSFHSQELNHRKLSATNSEFNSRERQHVHRNTRLTKIQEVLILDRIV